MGQEIVYCFKCQNRLKGEDFDKGSAFRIGDKTCCATCAVGLLTSLPPEEQQSILAKVMTSQSASTKKLVVNGEVIEPGGPSTPAPAAPRPGDGTSKTKVAPPRTYRAQAQKKSTLRVLGGGSKVLPVLIGVGLVVAVILGLVVMTGGSRGRPGAAPSTAADPTAARPDEPTARDLPPAGLASEPAIPPRPTGTAREETAKKSLDKARAADPADLGAKVRLYQQAVWDSEGTPFFDEATKELAPLLDKWKAKLASEHAALDETVRGLLEKQDFKAALEACDKARRMFADADWTAPIDRKIAAVRKQIDDAYGALKEKAIDAKRRGDSAEVARITDVVARWGFNDYASSLARTLADVAVAPPSEPAAKPEPAKSEPPVKVEDEGIVYRARWDQAMAHASTREYAAATRVLEQAAGPIQNSTLRGEALADLENVRAVSAMVAETMEVLSEWPEGRALPLKYIDETGARRSTNDAVVHVNRHRAELRKGKNATHFVEFMDVEAESLAKIFKSRKNRQKTDGRAAAYFCLFEGDDDTAKSVLGEPVGAIPEKYWALAKRIREQKAKAPKPDAEAVRKERDARDILHAAEKEYRTMATRSEAVEKYKTLLSAFAETRIVRGQHESIALRSEGDKEYLFTAEEMKGAGMMRLNREPKDGARVWLAEQEPEGGKPNANYVEFEFYAVAGQQYRIFLNYGGCCVETMSLRMQGTDLVGTNAQNQQVAIEPGGNTALNVTFRSDRIPARHADHGGGRKEATEWQTLQITALPRYNTGGLKRVRLLVDHMGVSIKYAVVTCIRNGFPTAAEVRRLGDDR